MAILNGYKKNIEKFSIMLVFLKCFSTWFEN